MGNPHAPPYLKDVITRAHVCDIHPLAINIMPIGVPAADGHSLFPKVGTRIAPLQSCGRGVPVTEALGRYSGPSSLLSLFMDSSIYLSHQPHQSDLTCSQTRGPVSAK